jgi:hypothetical protein
MADLASTIAKRRPVAKDGCIAAVVAFIAVLIAYMVAIPAQMHRAVVAEIDALK